MPQFKIKRIYDKPSKEDGLRVLVDRLWPRGVSKEQARLDDWNKDLAPSSEIRKWFNHEPEKFEEFSARYVEELIDNAAVSEFIKSNANESKITLLYGARDPEINHAVVLKKYLENYEK